MSFDKAAAAANLSTQSGKQAIEKRYRSHIIADKGVSITHSSDLDSHFESAEPSANRWDYGVGVYIGQKHYAIWIEPHGATSSSEVNCVIAKLNWLKAKLRLTTWSQLQALTKASQTDKIQEFWWLVPGTVCFRQGSKEQKKLAQHGMKMPTKKVVIGKPL